MGRGEVWAERELGAGGERVEQGLFPRFMDFSISRGRPGG